MNRILQRVTPINVEQSGDLHCSAFSQRTDDVQSHSADGRQDAAEEAHDEGQQHALREDTRAEAEGECDFAELIHRAGGKSVEW